MKIVKVNVTQTAATHGIQPRSCYQDEAHVVSLNYGGGRKLKPHSTRRLVSTFSKAMRLEIATKKNA
jgi:hypothetical protein